MTLTEVIMALGVIALLLPLVLAIFSNSAQSAREARNDTRAALIARAVFAELEIARKAGRSQWFEVRPPLLAMESDEPLVLGFNDEGEFISELDQAAWETGLNTGGGAQSASYLVRIDGERHDSVGGAISRKLRCQVSSPARASLASRSQYEFIGLMQPVPPS